MHGIETLRAKQLEIVDCIKRWGVKPKLRDIGKVVNDSAWRTVITPQLTDVPHCRQFVKQMKSVAQFADKHMQGYSETKKIEEDFYYPMLEAVTEIIKSYDESIDYNYLALIERLNK